jgi:N-acetylmuramic acid 6-phosphate (MurNAc-6-P) etherase
MLSLFAPRAAELACKHAINGISTGAHVIIGKVFGAQMIDVRVSNEKLFHRAVHIVHEVAGVGLLAGRQGGL